jgi:Fe-S oxidoreductase
MRVLDLGNLRERQRKSVFAQVIPHVQANVCDTCGVCSIECPLTATASTNKDLDCRRAMRMALVGLDQELIESRFVWLCTGCYRCVYGCPHGIQLTDLWFRAKSLCPRDKVPGLLHQGVETCLKTGNNRGIPAGDYGALLEKLGGELAREGCPGFAVPVDKVGADYIFFENSREVDAEPQDLKWWWKIFEAAKANWTTPSTNWESEDWGSFTCDWAASREMARRKVENMERLKARTLILPDSGDSSWGTRLNLEKYFKHHFGPETGHDYVYSFDVLLKWLKEGRINVDRSVFAGRTVTWHDSCKHGRAAYYAFGDTRFEETREIISYLIDRNQFREMFHNRMNSLCCGAGAGNGPGPYEAEKTEHGRLLAEDIKATGADLVLTGCSDCRDQIMKNLKPKFDLDIEVKYLWEAIADGLILEEDSDRGNSIPLPLKCASTGR